MGYAKEIFCISCSLELQLKRMNIEYSFITKNLLRYEVDCIFYGIEVENDINLLTKKSANMDNSSI